MGEVLHGHDEVLDRPVAIKLLRKELASDPASLERFRREARIAASLSHPGIASVFDFVEEGEGCPLMVMELLVGHDLHTILSREGPLDPALAAAVAVQTAVALDHAHRAGAVHRDVKPGNIFLTSSGEVKVTDFGIASAASHTSSPSGGKLIGTLHYLSPEQVRGEEATPASDLYSLGCVLFEMLTGRPPFEGEDDLAAATARLGATPPSPRAINPRVPKALAEVVDRALAENPEDRFPSAGVMAEAIRRASGASGALPPIPVVWAGSEAGAGDRHRPTVSALAAPPTRIEKIALTPRPQQTRGILGPAARRRMPRMARLGIVLVVGLATWAVVASLMSLVRGPLQITLPTWVGLPYEKAKAEADRLGLEVERLDDSSERPAGEVLRQLPVPATKIEQGEVVTFFVSLGDQVRMPRVIGMDQTDARVMLRQSGLESTILVKRVPGPRDGLVMAQDPASGSVVLRSSQVMLSVSFHQGGSADPGEIEGIIEGFLDRVLRDLPGRPRG